MKKIQTGRVEINSNIARIDGEVYTSSIQNFTMTGNYELSLVEESFPYDFKVIKIVPLYNKIQSSGQFYFYLKDLLSHVYYEKTAKIKAKKFLIEYYDISEAKIYLDGNYIGRLFHRGNNVRFQFTVENKNLQIVDLLFNSCGFSPIIDGEFIDVSDTSHNNKNRKNETAFIKSSEIKSIPKESPKPLTLLEKFKKWIFNAF